MRKLVMLKVNSPQKKMKKETVLTFLLGDDNDGVSSRGEEVDKFLQEKPVPSDTIGLEWWGKLRLPIISFSDKAILMCPSHFGTS